MVPHRVSKARLRSGRLDKAATAVSSKVEPMAEPLNPYYAAQLVDELEGNLARPAHASSAENLDAPTADAGDVVDSVPGVPEPPD
jgi:hypothetical protein